MLCYAAKTLVRHSRSSNTMCNVKYKVKVRPRVQESSSASSGERSAFTQHYYASLAGNVSFH